MYKDIWCTGCKTHVRARLTSGAEMYPAREELRELPFWVHDECGAFVGTHHKTKSPLKPLGFLATPEVKKWRKMIHAVLDPLWKSGKIARGRAYREISDAFGRNFHTAEIYDVEEGQKVYEIVRAMKDRLDPGPWNK